MATFAAPIRVSSAAGSRAGLTGAILWPEAFQRLLQMSRSPRYCKLLVCLKDTGQIIGSLNLNNISAAPFLSTTMGYWIGKQWTNNGYMTEAVNVAVGHAFTTLKLHRVEANIMPINKASLALIRKCGFRFEGLAKRYLQINGKWHDHERWAMTVEDWQEQAPGSARERR